MYENFGFTRSSAGDQNIVLFVPDNSVDATQYIVLNFSDALQYVDVPLPQNGVWIDLLNNNFQYNCSNYRLYNFAVQSNWGCILHWKK
jgi:hypothetical protein